jgi:diguanylate cyclase (GGDEF)-like protein/putative nucleotidyltransferase with HDIG domain
MFIPLNGVTKIMAKSKLSILVANNSHPGLELIKTSLNNDENMKYEIDAAESSKDALKKASEEKVDLVLVNQKKSGTEGIKMLQSIIRKKLGIPVIMIIAEGDEKLGVKAMDNGAYDFLTNDEVKTVALSRAIRRVMQRRKLEIDVNETLSKLEKLAIRDGLTGLYNQHHFKEAITREYKKARRYVQSLSCIMLDLDHFKAVNDTHGHQFGDEVLRQSADILNKLVRDTDFVARYGGEEFFIILPNTNLEGAHTLAERIRAAFADHIFIKDDISEIVTVSIGVSATSDENVISENDLISNADKSLYRAKWRGRNNVCAYEEPEIKPTNGLREDVKKLENFDGKLKNLNDNIKENCIESAHDILREIEKGWDYINEHSIRVSRYVEQLTKALKLSDEEIMIVRRAALLHDIGMVGVSSKILKKKTALSDDEYDVVKKHSNIGVKIIKKTKLFENELPLILYHHERYDGTGYPHQLKGDTIPYGARILAVAEAYDAMLSNSIYRKSYSSKEAIAELKECSGSQFDPKVVDVFVKVINKSS